MENFRIEKNILVKYTGNETHIVIPDHVRVIGAQAFAFNTTVVSVVIPKGVVTIGERAFDSCTSLESIEIPKTVSLIEKNAFSSCKKLDNVVIPEGVPFIAAKTFYMCLSLKTVTLPQSVTSINDEAFARCISIEEFAVGDDVIEIGEKAFMECYGLKNLMIGRGIEVVKWSTFASCRSLEKIAFTSTLREIEYGAFDNCPAIKDVYFDEADDIWRQISVKPTRNETLIAATYHYDYTGSIVSYAKPSYVEDVETEVVEDPTVTDTVLTDETDGQLSFKIIEELPVVTEETDASEETPEETDTPVDTSDAAQITIDEVETPVETPEETPVETPVAPVETPAVPVTPATSVTKTPAAKRPHVRTTPKSAQSTVTESFKKEFYRSFLAKLGDEAVAAFEAKAKTIDDETFETRSEALFLVPADEAYEFGCICLVLGKYNWAFRSFLSAAGKGSVPSQFYVGACFLFGLDTTKKIVDAARWLTKCKNDPVFGEDAVKLIAIVDEELEKPENLSLKVKRGNK
ncbi:MAG: leucine-rich repeat protein [Clostridia bacterium]|nr:leucine-rich repeat protein [Clostridia bacterium]